MILHSLILSGNIGIERGLGLDKITIPFGNFNNGLVMIQGRMGTGKSSIIKNLTPYRELPTDKFGDFKNFFSEDGYKDLEFTFKEKHYRCQVYHKVAKIFEDDELLNKDEKLTEYDTIVQDRFGSPDYFFKMLFSGSNYKGMSELTKGERKDVVINYLAPHLKQYELLKKQFEVDMLKVEKDLDIVRDRLSSADNLEQEIEDIIKFIKTNSTQRDKYIDDRKAKIKEVDTLAKELKKLTKVYAHIERLTDEIDRIGEEVSYKRSILEEKLNDYNNQLSDLPDTTDITMRLSDIADSIEEEYERGGKYLKDKKKYKEKLKSDTKDLILIKAKQEEIDALNKDASRLDRQIEAFSKEKHPCTDLLKENRKQLEKKIIASEKILKSYPSITDAELNNIQKRIYAIENYEVAYPSLLEQEKALKKELRTTKGTIQAIEEKIKSTEGELRGMEKKHTMDVKKKKDAIKAYGKDPTTEMLKIKESIKQLDNSLDILDEDIDTFNLSLERQKARLELLQEDIGNIEEDRKNEKRYTLMLENYKQLVKFCSKEGYIIYDLENIGEDISQIANQELLPYYEYKKFEMRFDTLRNNKEVFDILVSINGQEQQELYSCSSGEKVCCNVAIKEAMNYIKEDKAFRSGFIDEIDGAIDPESRNDFFNMLRRAHKLNNRYHTFLISHSTEIINEIHQRIELKEGKINLIY